MPQAKTPSFSLKIQGFTLVRSPLSIVSDVLRKPLGLRRRPRPYKTPCLADPSESSGFDRFSHRIRSRSSWGGLSGRGEGRPALHLVSKQAYLNTTVSRAGTRSGGGLFPGRWGRRETGLGRRGTRANEEPGQGENQQNFHGLQCRNRGPHTIVTRALLEGDKRTAWFVARYFALSIPATTRFGTAPT